MRMQMQIAELWFPYDRRIANDRRWSQTIADDRRRSQKCVSIWSQTIAELSAICDLRSAPRSSAIIWKPAFSRAGNMCCGNKFCCSETKNVFAWSQKHFCFPDTNFASETYVSQFSHPGKHNKKHCFRNNVSLFSQALSFNSLYWFYLGWFERTPHRKRALQIKTERCDLIFTNFSIFVLSLMKNYYSSPNGLRVISITQLVD